ncbi:hypothetical protein [Bradyrhizobium sp.]|uniref:hypothetical protein n=1 Tax=Bradyrhizobium sp. TaxID=376 RepID=UPI0025B9ACC5|nr:hypothetical protein [Bradyrhizobium sp.]
MADLFASGRLVDLIFVLVVLEAAFLLVYWHRAGRGVAPLDLLPNLCAGAFLLLALRATLAGGGWMQASGCLAAAGLAHLADLHRRWRK